MQAVAQELPPPRGEVVRFPEGTAYAQAGPNYVEVKAAQDEAAAGAKNPEHERWLRQQAVWDVMGGMML